MGEVSQKIEEVRSVLGGHWDQLGEVETAEECGDARPVWELVDFLCRSDPAALDYLHASILLRLSTCWTGFTEDSAFPEFAEKFCVALQGEVGPSTLGDLLPIDVPPETTGMDEYPCIAEVADLAVGFLRDRRAEQSAHLLGIADVAFDVSPMAPGFRDWLVDTILVALEHKTAS